MHNSTDCNIFWAKNAGANLTSKTQKFPLSKSVSNCITTAVPSTTVQLLYSSSNQLFIKTMICLKLDPSISYKPYRLEFVHVICPWEENHS